VGVFTTAVTGGTGKIGSAVVERVIDGGLEAVAVDWADHPKSTADTVIHADLLDAGDVYGAIGKSGADAVVHIGMVPEPYNDPDFSVYESNVRSAWNVLEAADSLELASVCLPSSSNVIGSEHQEHDVTVRCLPVDEQHPRTPDDPYSIAKHATEVTADGFGQRSATDLTVASLRFPCVVNNAEMDEYLVRPDRSLDTPTESAPRRVGTYCFRISTSRTRRRAPIEADFAGHEVFWTTAADATTGSDSDCYGLSTCFCRPRGVSLSASSLIPVAG
jgi:NAD(P)-dependent dehydrogenase (short-subunit alcohol dehydrogenase family)